MNCKTHYAVYGFQEELESLYLRLQKLQQKSQEKDRDGNVIILLEDFLQEMEYCPTPGNEWEEEESREGYLFNVFFEEGERFLQFDVMTSGRHALSVRKAVNDAYGPNANTLFESIEACGTEYVSNDSSDIFFHNICYLESDAGKYYYDNEEDALKAIQDVFGKEVGDNLRDAAERAEVWSTMEHGFSAVLLKQYVSE